MLRVGATPMPHSLLSHPTLPSPSPFPWAGGGGAGGGGGGFVSICTTSVCVIFQKVLPGSLSAMHCQFLGYNFSMVYLGSGCRGSLFCLVSWSSNTQEAFAVFVKANRSQGAVANVGHTQVLLCYSEIKFSHLFLLISTYSSQPHLSPIPTSPHSFFQRDSDRWQ